MAQIWLTYSLYMAYPFSATECNMGFPTFHSTIMIEYYFCQRGSSIEQTAPAYKGN